MANLPKLVVLEKCSKPTLRWYSGMVGRTIKVKHALHFDRVQKVMGVNLKDCYAYVSDNTELHGKLILISDCADVQRGTNPRKK